MKKIFAFLPCYNEEKDIVPLVEKWIKMNDKINKCGYDLKVCCIDDKSSDGTNYAIRQLEEKYVPIVLLLEHDINKGLGGVLRTSFQFFIENASDKDICVLMDGDNTHDPCYVISMIREIEKGCDCVIASRYCSDSETNGVSIFRLLLSWGARLYYTLILGVPNVRDYTCGYRAYTYQIIEKAQKKYGDAFIEHRSFVCMMEVLYKLFLLNAKFQEVPFELKYNNKQGESKMKILKTVKDSLWTAFQLRLNRKKIVE